MSKARKWWVLGPLFVILTPIVAYSPFLVWEYSRPQPDIIPGSGPVSTATAPWVVVIGNPTTMSDRPGNKLCVGTLVAPRAVVTATHCLGHSKPSELTVTIGRDDLRGNAGRVVKVAGTWLEPRYTQGVAEESFVGGAFGRITMASADIGLVTLAEPVDTPTLPMADAAPRAGEAATVYGWRMSPDDTPVLWQAPTTVGEDAECVRRAADSARFVPPRWHGVSYDQSSYLCVGTERAIRLRATDSGSPVVVNGRLAGVAAWSASADPAAPDYYTKVATFRPHLARLINDIR
ncbi:trypsin-like serine protease [Allokutzneria sp. A3M-2-11 16]|uniref:S1 family peptidase n=1 Tax=Allokutzneria sp. A3M-2-11 16 TaxID=2962043 RepID=UPI0020B835E3|nr:trypsin-like serine protease [Allokutzneria sp. A3M-2-11 16]MCP3804587.1 trypsin-like serine protease [Allokutzneria sp. A3M-2-11 16]